MTSTPPHDTTRSEDGMVHSELLSAIIDRVREKATTHLPENRTLDVKAWDDGDISVRIMHTGQFHFNPDGLFPNQERYEVKYKPDEDRIIYRHYVENGGDVVEVLDKHTVDENVLGEQIDVVEVDYEVGV